MTKDQVMALTHGQTLHYTGKLPCERKTGPRGGINDRVVRVRVSGACKTWKTRPEEFERPVKHGLYESAYISHRNAGDFHTPADCPAGIAF